MSILSQLRSFCSRCLPIPKSQPDCPACQAIRRCHARKIAELGIGAGQRAARMIEAARRASPGEAIHYVGMDRFEGRCETDGPGLSLKAAHQLLRADGVRVQLVPGDPAETLMRVANSLGKVDLLIVPAEMDSPAFARTWFFVPRMLHEQSLVFVERTAEDGSALLTLKPRQEIDALASVAARRAA